MPCVMLGLSYSRASSLQEIRGLTGARGLAALAVFLFHINLLLFGGKYVPIISTGFSGVDFFFVLTGFLLWKLYGSNLNPRKYFTRRIFRTFPLYYLTIPLYVVAGLQLFTPLDFFYLQNFLPSTFALDSVWTLCVEETFYFAVFPLVMLAVRRGWLKYMLPLSAALSLSYGVLLPSNFFHAQMPAFLVCYLFGIWAAQANLRAGDKALAIFWWAVCALTVGSGPVEPLLYGSAFALVLVEFQDARFFSNKVSYYLGKISYGVYIVQVPLLVLFGFWGIPLTLGLAALSYHYFESPLINLGRKLTT